MFAETLLLGLSAALSCVLGILVLFRNPGKRTHRLFTVLSLNLALWALGVLFIVHCHTMVMARTWVTATFIIASFLPATFYHFIVYFPDQRFEGRKSVLTLLYFGSLIQIVGTFTPFYIVQITCQPDFRPIVKYGPVFHAYSFWVLLSMLFSFTNLAKKLHDATGIERRQVEHVLIGIVLCTTFATVTNVVAPVMQVGSLEVYGPIFTVLMMGMVAYAMIRYHLLDIWVLVSRTTIYAIVTVFVVATFLSTVSLVHWVFSRRGQTSEVVTTVCAALVIALVIQPLKERLQLLAERTVLKRRYDVNRLCARITRHAAQFMRLDQLLNTVVRDIRATMGVEVIRVWLVDEKDPLTILCQYSSVPGDLKTISSQYLVLLDYIRDNTDPIVLKKLLHERPNEHRVRLAAQLAELDAFLCIPLHASSGLVGMLTLGEKTSGDIYTMDDLAVFATVSGPLGTAIENARLYLKLEEVNLHLARILSSMRGGVVAVDGNGKVTTFNDSAVPILGKIEIGQSLDRLCPEIAQVLRQTLTDARGVGDYETLIRRADGDNIPVVISSSCLESPGKGHYGAMVMIHDQTQVKRLEQNVKRADRLSSIGTLAAGMAHEVKNPLVSIKTFTQLLLARYEDADFRKTFAEVVPHEVDRIDTIVSRLLDFARPKPVCFAPQNLVRIVEHVMALVENQTRKANVTVRLEFPDDEVSVYGDEQQLHQVFLNLALNAIEALKDVRGGDLSITMFYDRTHLRRNGLVPYLETDCVRVLVFDSGCGIAPEHIEHLFTPFFTTKAEGCGLGLSVVHGIVTEHGGIIDVESAPGAGTTFTVTFPVMKVGAASVS